MCVTYFVNINCCQLPQRSNADQKEMFMVQNKIVLPTSLAIGRAEKHHWWETELKIWTNLRKWNTMGAYFSVQTLYFSLFLSKCDFLPFLIRSQISPNNYLFIYNITNHVSQSKQRQQSLNRREKLQHQLLTMLSFHTLSHAVSSQFAP